MSTDSLHTYVRSMGDEPLLRPWEEKALARRRDAGDVGARDELVRRNLRLVYSMARRYLASGIPLLDLIQQGNIGLIRAAEKFDADAGTRFSTYAVFWIRQAIERYTGRDRAIAVPESIRPKLMAMHGVRERLLAELGREPTDAEIAERVGGGTEKLIAELRITDRPSSLDDPHSPYDAEAPTDAHDDAVSRQMTEDVRRALSVLPPREREVLILHYWECLSLAECARRMGLETRRAEWIARQARTRLAQKAPHLAAYVA